MISRSARRSVQGLTRFLTKLLCSILALAQTLHFAVRIRLGAAALRCRTLHPAHIIRRAISHAAHDAPISIPHRAAARFGAEHLAVLIRGTLALSAHYISILVLDAIPGGIDLSATASANKQPITTNPPAEKLFMNTSPSSTIITNVRPVAQVACAGICLQGSA